MQTEQKKTDFKSENDETFNQSTSACSKAIKVVENQVRKISNCLDGKNVNNALRELGIKFHRCIYDHLLKFEYNEQGIIISYCNLKKY